MGISIKTIAEIAEENTVSLATLNKSDWERVIINKPPVSEQQKIVDYLDEQCGNIDKIIAKLNEEIALFSEYRTRLISDEVTGKFDVRGVAVPEFEAVRDGESEEETEDEE